MISQYLIMMAIVIIIIALYANHAFKNSHTEESPPNGAYIEIISYGISTYLGENSIAESFGNATLLGKIVPRECVINFSSERERYRVANELILMGFVEVNESER